MKTPSIAMAVQSNEFQLGPRLSDSQAVTLLINLYQQQFLKGCENSNCKTPTCYTYCKRESDKPVRKLSLASARATAFYLADSENPESELCPHIMESVLRRYPAEPDLVTTAGRKSNNQTKEWLQYWTSKENQQLLNSEAARQDPSSFSQRLFSSGNVKQFIKYPCSPRAKHNTDSKTLRSVLIEAEIHLTAGFGRFSVHCDSAAAVAGILHGVSCLSKCYESMDSEQDHKHNWTTIDPLALRLASTIARILATLISKSREEMLTYSGLENFLRHAKPVSPENHLLSQLLFRIVHDAAVKSIFTDLALWMWLLIVKNWDHNSMIHREGPVSAALSVLEILMNFELISSIAPPESLLRLRDPLKAAYEWREQLKGASYSTEHTSLLQYPFAITRDSQVKYFRALCFYRMSDAVDDSRLNVRLLYNSASGLIHDARPPHQGQSLQTGRLQMAMSKHLTLQVYRHTILSDALDELWRRQNRELLRPLRVKMLNAGEVGVDQGGLAQEFFRLAFIEALNPEYAIFNVDERTRMAWFDPKSLEPLYKYELLGLIMALAVFNGFTLPVTFPLALYRKLCGAPVKTLEHIEQGWPELATGLKQLQNWEQGDVSDVFMRSYTFTFAAFGSMVHVDMTKDETGDDWSPIVAMTNNQSSEDNAPLVTNATRTQYISDYIFWLTDKSVRRQYEAFEKGFHTVLEWSFLQSITPEVLQEIVEGQQFIDTRALAREAKYDAGYSKQKPYIKDFWALVHSYDDERKRKFLEFVTASDRIPVTGIESVDFIVQRHGGDTESLPTSVTCFGRLLLPEYGSKEKLARKLELALENSRGFGLS